FGKPLLARLAGETPRPPLGFPLPAGFTMKKKAGRREYLRVRVIDDGDGPQVVPAGREGSGILTTLVAADGLWSAPEDWSAVSPGDVGLFRPFPELAL
ncbi:MAG: molybdopterin molybdenumtransferase MoeA, partial [Pseudomonadota bacterium]